MTLFFKSVIIYALAAGGALFFLVGCATSMGRDTSVREIIPTHDGPQPDYLLIYLIHGDASYSFHDRKGRRHRADQEVVSQALEVAEAGLNAEVFIFHQQPARSRFFRPQKDGTLYHYRFGKKVREENYFRYPGESRLGGEADLFRRYSLPAPVRFFAYFGHEIPERDGRGYSGSYPAKNFSLTELSQTLQAFTGSGENPVDGHGKPFALIMLSTCKGGEPKPVDRLSTFTDFIVASPGDLHLSYFDSRAFADVLQKPLSLGKTEVQALGKELVHQSFVRLKKATQTEITIGLWDTEKSDKVSRKEGNEEGLRPAGWVEFLHQPPRFGSPQFSAP